VDTLGTWWLGYVLLLKILIFDTEIHKSQWAKKILTQYGLGELCKQDFCAACIRTKMRSIILVLILTLYSCSTVKIDQSEKRLFNIKVKNDPRRYLIGDNSDIVVYLIGTDDLDSKLINKGIMTVEMVTEKKVKLSFDIGDRKIEKIFKGRLVDDEFRFKNRLKVKLFPPIYWALIGDLATIFQNKNNELVIVVRHSGAIFLTLMPIFGTTNEPRTIKFQEID
jgi:hypothetical protein